MGGTVEDLIASHRRNGVWVDANLLLVHLLGRCGPALVAEFSRTKGRYTADDVPVLERFLARFARMLTTPHVLTEVSNLAGKLRPDLKSRFFSTFADWVALADERHLPCVEVVGSPLLATFGLTDLALAELAAGDGLVLTDDWRASAYLYSRGVEVVNFQSIRSSNW